MSINFNYQCALTYVDFDAQNKDIIYFKNQSEKETFFNLSTLFQNAIEINFEKKNLVDVDFVIPLNNTDIIKNEFNFNYCIIKEKSTNEYYFYFVNKQTYLNDGRMTIKCHLDIFTTYFDKLVFEGIIKRATLREFDKENNDIIYNTGAYSHVFNVDDTYLNKKFLQHDKCLQPHVFTYLNNATLDSWMEENIECWQYLFVDSSHTYNYDSTSYKKVDEFMSNGVESGFGVLAMPIYKTTASMHVRFRDVRDADNPVQYDIDLSDSAISYFNDANNGNAFVYSSKLSKQPPFTPLLSSNDIHNFRCNITTSGSNLFFDFGDVIDGQIDHLLQNYVNTFITHNITSSYFIGMLQMNFQTKRYYNNNVSSIVQDYINTRMSKTKYLSNSIEFWKYPNATSLKNIELKLTYNGQEYSTTPSKIDTGNAIIEMLEAINPDITKIYVRWKTTGYYAFRYANDKTLTGGIFSDDLMLNLGTSKLQETLANAKNFFEQKRINIGVRNIMNFAESISSVKSSMDVAKAGMKTLANEQMDEINFGYLVDNIENAPSHLDKASGNALFNMLTKEFGLHLEIWMMTEEELTNIAQYYNKFGVSTNTHGTLFEILEKHKYFDYVEFDSYFIHDGNGGLNLKITNEIKEEFKRKLQRGVRFWYDSTKLYNYSLYNYENALE